MATRKTAPGSHRPVRLDRFVLPLLTVAAAGVVARLAYVFTVGRHLSVGLDTVWYQLVGRQIADGVGYLDPERLLSAGISRPTANFPPLYPVFIAGQDTLGLDTVFRQQVVAAVVGGGTVLLVGLLGRRLGGRRVGLVAAALAAFSPALIAADAALMAEVIALPLVVGAVLALCRALDADDRAGTIGPWLLAGLLFGLAGLSRSEVPIVAAVVLLAVVFFARSVSLPRRLVGSAATLALLLGVLLPWGLNRAAAVGPAALLPSNGAKTLAGANCARTYAGPDLGSWQFSCVADAVDPRAAEQRQIEQGRSRGVAYGRNHLGRLPLVAGARAARTAGLWSPGPQVAFEADESRNAGWQRLAWALNLLLLPLAVVGFLLCRRGSPRVLLLGLVLGVAAVSVITYGNPRFRILAEPALLAAAGVAIVQLGRRWPSAQASTSETAAVGGLPRGVRRRSGLVH